eukprot:scaffold46307_cov22-Tisochrysis_lutea.AAC.1
MCAGECQSSQVKAIPHTTMATSTPMLTDTPMHTRSHLRVAVLAATCALAAAAARAAGWVMRRRWPYAALAGGQAGAARGAVGTPPASAWGWAWEFRREGGGLRGG